MQLRNKTILIALVIFTGIFMISGNSLVYASSDYNNHDHNDNYDNQTTTFKIDYLWRIFWNIPH